MNPAVKEPASLDSVLQLIGKKLIELRVKKGYSSHAEFAARYNLPRIQYWRMEKGKANITIKSLHKVLEVHNISLEDLFLSISNDVARVKDKKSNGKK